MPALCGSRWPAPERGATRPVTRPLQCCLPSVSDPQCNAVGLLRQGHAPRRDGRRLGLARFAHERPSRCHRGRLWRDGILGCQAQRCSVTAQPGGATLHPLSHHTGMRVYGPLQPWLVVPVAGGQRGGNRAPTPLVGRCAPLLVERSFTLGCVPHHWVATSSTPPAGCCGVFLPPGRRAR